MQQTFAVVRESFVSRCEICHKQDFFDVAQNTCVRCKNIKLLQSDNVSLLTKANIKTTLVDRLAELSVPFFYLYIGLVAGIFIGSFLEGIAIAIIFQWFKESRFSKQFNYIFGLLLLILLGLTTLMFIFQILFPPINNGYA